MWFYLAFWFHNERRVRWLGQVLQMKDDRLIKIVLFGQTKSRSGWEVVRNDLMEIETSLEVVKLL